MTEDGTATHILVPRAFAVAGEEWRWRDLNEPPQMWNGGYTDRSSAEASIAQCNRVIFERRGLPSMLTVMQRRRVIRGTEASDAFGPPVIALTAWEDVL